MKRSAIRHAVLREVTVAFRNQFLLTLGPMFASAAGAAAADLEIKDAKFTLGGKPTFRGGVYPARPGRYAAARFQLDSRLGNLGLLWQRCVGGGRRQPA